MVHKSPIPAKGAQHPKTAVPTKPQPTLDAKLDELDEELRTKFEDWRKEQERIGRRETPDELLKEFLENKIKRNAAKKDKFLLGDDGKCGAKRTRMDLELLAEKVFTRLICEARIERERSGWAG